MKVKDNAAQISAMETSLPYLYMLRQLYLAYLEAWAQLCGGQRGKCERLAALQPSAFIQTYFNPSIKARRKTPISFMLIVYRSSAVEDYLDLEIPSEREEEEEVSSSSSTVSAVMSTMQEEAGTIVPTVVITQTVSTINLTESSTTPAVTTQTEATTSSSSRPEEERQDLLERCRKYNACVVYLVQEPPSQELNQLLAVGAGLNRRSGLSVGTALVRTSQMYDVTLPRNTIATVTIQDKGKK